MVSAGNSWRVKSFTIKGSNKIVGKHKSRQCNQSLAVPATERNAAVHCAGSNGREAC